MLALCFDQVTGGRGTRPREMTLVIDNAYVEVDEVLAGPIKLDACVGSS